jgi:3-deoxy-D-manno-octulosonic-acid transferase
MLLLYNFAIHTYGLIIRIAALFNSKAALWIKGRQGWETRVSDFRKTNSGKLAWIHCASLGEFEQGRPVIEYIRQRYPDIKILLTFFSPSGYEARKKYEGADGVFYLPLDTPGNARKWLKIVQPSIAVFVKYEFWLNHLKSLRRSDIPHILIAANFRKNQVFFKSYGAIFRQGLRGYHNIFTQNQKSTTLLKQIDIDSQIAGDTRFDRVLKILDEQHPLPIIEKFLGSNSCIVAGSTWHQDEIVVFPALRNTRPGSMKLIIAPHDINSDRIRSVEQNLVNAGWNIDEIGKISQNQSIDISTKNVLIVDNIGMLNKLYRYAEICFIGGGFAKNIHNTLEAAVYYKPLIFGPKYEKFEEAKELLNVGGAMTVSNQQQIEIVLRKLLTDQNLRAKTGSLAGQYVAANKGAVDKIVSAIDRLLSR